MTDTPPFIAGQDAARMGHPASVCPTPAPGPQDRPPSGDAYPGDWANWIGGWCFQMRLLGRDPGETLAALDAFRLRGVYRG